MRRLKMLVDLLITFTSFSTGLVVLTTSQPAHPLRQDTL